MANGDKILRTVANSLITKQQNIHTVVNNNLKPALDYIANITDEIKKFVVSDYNAYVFDKDLIERFFAGDPENPDEKAECLVVFVAAQYSTAGGNIVGDPTIITAGCNYNEDSGEYETLNLTYPANEHPPKKAYASFPPPEAVQVSKIVNNKVIEVPDGSTRKITKQLGKISFKIE